MNNYIEKAIPVTEQKWDENTIPLVSISCITYNHENFIRDAIEGFLMQRTTFPVEILIHDDASTDKTAEIVREYEQKFPQLIKPIYQTENQYSKGKKISATYNYPRAKGKYIALCEGDDYWTDPLKLQKQVDFMEANPEYGMCYTSFNILFNSTGKVIQNAAKSLHNIYPMKYSNQEEFIIKKGYVCPPSWLFLRSLLMQYNPINCACDGSFCMFSFFMSKTKVYFLNDVTCTYRVLKNSASHSRVPLIDYQRRKDLLELQFQLVDQYNLSDNIKQKCKFQFYKRNLMFFAENHLIEELETFNATIINKTLKERFFVMLGRNIMGSYLLKTIHKLYCFLKGY
ncbi:MAG: hypothetical protein PWP16_742 [Eubacteriaceae bacterium]|nr:hypothetical protein [Eubacteriaceae bacterium]